MFIKKEFENNGNMVEYFIDYPKNFDKNKKYPVIIYLHGYSNEKRSEEFFLEHCPVKRARL